MRRDDHQEADAAQPIEPRAVETLLVVRKAEFGIIASLGQQGGPCAAIRVMRSWPIQSRIDPPPSRPRRPWNPPSPWDGWKRTGKYLGKPGDKHPRLGVRG